MLYFVQDGDAVSEANKTCHSARHALFDREPGMEGMSVLHDYATITSACCSSLLPAMQSGPHNICDLAQYAGTGKARCCRSSSIQVPLPEVVNHPCQQCHVTPTTINLPKMLGSAQTHQDIMRSATPWPGYSMALHVSRSACLATRIPAGLLKDLVVTSNLFVSSGSMHRCRRDRYQIILSRRQGSGGPTSRMSLSMDLGTPTTEHSTPLASQPSWMALAAALPPLPPMTNSMLTPHRSRRFTMDLMSAPPRDVPWPQLGLLVQEGFAIKSCMRTLGGCLNAQVVMKSSDLQTPPQGVH